jgi:hypothetical protein
MQVHHIVPEAQGGPDTIQNAIPLCFDCHEEVGSYNPAHPMGRKFSCDELRRHRDLWFEFVKAHPERLAPADDSLLRHLGPRVTSTAEVCATVEPHYEMARVWSRPRGEHDKEVLYARVRNRGSRDIFVEVIGFTAGERRLPGLFSPRSAKDDANEARQIAAGASQLFSFYGVTMDSDDITRIDGMFVILGTGEQFVNKQTSMDRVKTEFVEGEHREAFAKAEAARLRQAGKLPVLTLEGRVAAHDRHFMHVELCVRNLSQIPAIDPSLSFDAPSLQREINSLEQGQQQLLKIRLPRTINTETRIAVVIRFRIPDEQMFVERGALTVKYNPAKPADGSVSYRSEAVELEAD